MKKNVQDNAGLSAIYCTGIIGAAIYYIQTSSGIAEIIWGLIKSLFWPGVFVYEALKMFNL